MATELPESQLTLAAREWKIEREKLALEMERLGLRLAELDGKLAAIRTLMPALDLEKIAAPAIAKSRSLENPKTIPDVLEAILLKAGGAHTLKSLLAAALQSDLGERIKSSQNGFYNAISRLTSRGQVVRDGEYIYAASVHAKTVSGEMEDVPQYELDTVTKTAFPDYIAHELLGNGLVSTKDLIQRIRAYDEVRDRLDRNPQYIYTILGRLVKRGQIVKKGGAYALPSEANEPLNGQTVGGSRASEGHHPSLFLSQPAAARH